MVLRAFIALPAPEPIRDGLARWQNRLRRADAAVSWIRPDLAHLTLVFLGDVLEEAVPPLSADLDAAAAAVPPFAYRVAGLGWFGPPRTPRVVWAGIPDPPPALADLQARCAAGAAALGHRLEDRPFHAHLTLGRIKSARNLPALTAQAASLTNESLGEARADRVLLMRSHREESSPRYTILHEALLKGT